jgi:hypothetical protein
MLHPKPVNVFCATGFRKSPLKFAQVNGIEPLSSGAIYCAARSYRVSRAFVPLLLHLGMESGGIGSHGPPDGLGPCVSMDIVQTIPDSV